MHLPSTWGTSWAISVRINLERILQIYSTSCETAITVPTALEACSKTSSHRLSANCCASTPLGLLSPSINGIRTTRPNTLKWQFSKLIRMIKFLQFGLLFFTYVGFTLSPSNTSQFTVKIGHVLGSLSKMHDPSLPLLNMDDATSPRILWFLRSSKTGGRVERLQRRGIKRSFTEA